MKDVLTPAVEWLVRLALLALLAASVRCPAQELALQEYGQADGLRNLAVSALAQDSAGLIWAGTQNGLYRFDGERFERVGLGDKLITVSSLLVDGERLWIGADETLWLREHDRLRRIGPLSGYPQNLAPAAGGGLWIVEGWRLVHLLPAGGGWRHEDALQGQHAIDKADRESVTSVASAPDGTLWFGCGHRICARRDGRFETWDAGRGVPEDTWHWLLVAADGSVWARGAQHVLQRSPGAAAFVDRTDRRDLADPLGLYPLQEDARHRIVGASRGALVRWNGRGWDRYEAAAGLPAGGRIHALLSDREGGLWIGMLGAGTLRWRGYGRWENWSTASGLPHSAVWRFARSGPPGRETLQVATGLGVASFDPERRRFVPLAATLGREVYGLSGDARGVLRVGTATGELLAWPSGTGGTPQRVMLPGTPSISDILAQRSGDVWVQTDRGLFHGGPGARVDAVLARVDPAQVGEGGFSPGCESPDGTAWFAGEKGLHRFSRGRWDRPWGDGRPVMALACLRDGGVLVSDGNDEVRRLVPEGPRFRVTDVTPALLRGLSVQALMEDRRGWWWISTDAGVLVGKDGAWRLLDRAAGLVWNDTSGGALFEDSDGSVWIGTSRGLSHLVDPAGLLSAATSAAIVQAVRRGTEPQATSGLVRVPWSHDALEIELAMPSYRDRDALAMEYRLPGFDDRWTRADHLEVRLTGLPPGRYRFEARAIDRVLGVPSPSTGFDLEIEPPWWRTPVAMGAAALLALLAVASAMRWRLGVHLRRERRLEAMVAERTRELEASREQLRELATKDGLTGVWNRRALMEILEREARRCGRERQPLAVVLCDIDHFKKVNDTHGHPAGDAVLREFATRLAAGLRPYDAVGRYGGEEFVIVMPGLDPRLPEHRARLVAIHAGIAAAPMQVGTVTCSFGVAGADGTAAIDVEALVARADAALYAAKRAGRDRIEWNGAP